MKFSIYLRANPFIERIHPHPIVIKPDRSDLHNLKGESRIFSGLACRTLVPLQIQYNIIHTMSLLSDPRQDLSYLFKYNPPDSVCQR